jgi:metal-responsive CopG/Arc/MetJ family transcriptional regulator
MKNKKITINFTIDPDLKTEFISMSNRNGINRSKLVSNYIKSWIIENNKIKNIDKYNEENQ